MAGRESEYTRGYIRGVAAMMNLVSSDKVERLDKSNVLEYAKQLVDNQRESD